MSDIESDSAMELDPNRNGVSNQDVSWLARGNSLRSKEQAGKRNRNRSTSLPTQSTEDTNTNKPGPNLPPIESASPRSSSPAGNESTNSNAAKDNSETYISNGMKYYKNDSGLLSRPFGSKDSKPVMLTNSPPIGSASDGGFEQQQQQTPPSQQQQRRPSWFQSFSSKFHHSENTSNDANSTVAADPQQQQQRPDPVKVSPPKVNTDNATSDNNSGLGVGLGRRISNTSTEAAASSPQQQQKGSLMNRLRRLSRNSTSNLNQSAAAATNSSSSISNNNESTSSPLGETPNSSRQSSVAAGSSFATDNNNTEDSSSRVILNKSLHKHHSKIPELEGVLPKRVMFSREVFQNDPPQQIPSRNPKQGNIEVGTNGEITKRQLASLCSISPFNSTPQNHYILPKNYSATALQAGQTAHESAVRIANALKNNINSNGNSNSSGARLRKVLSHPASIHNKSGAPLVATKSNDEGYYKNNDDESSSTEDDEDDDGVEVETKGTFDLNLTEVDKPMAPKGGFGGSDNTTTNDTNGCTNNLEDVYTRCCHLREILPIPATLKQVKGHRPPLDVIRLMNPKPTLIEILSFSDFLNIVPIHVIILDNCNLTDEMLETLFSSIMACKSLYKLSLRNVLIEGEKGWKYLCSFLSENTSLITLDLSIQTDAKRCKLKADADRSSVDWRLFTRALKIRGGVQELLLNGCMVPEAELDNLILEGCPNTKKLGLALNGLQCEDLAVLSKWISLPRTVCYGLDLGGNDMSNCMGTLADLISEAKDLYFLSLNSVNLHNNDDRNVDRLLNELSQLSHLRYLDLSSNADFFPSGTKKLSLALPKFKDLRRIHLDSNDLTSDTTVQLAESFSICARLVFISLLNNRKIDGTAVAALVMAVDMSSTIYTLEVDSDLIQPSVKKRLAHFCLVNMEHIIQGKACKSVDDGDKEMDLDENELFESGSELANAVGEILQNNQQNGDHEESNNHCLKVTNAMVKRARTVRNWIQNSLDRILSNKNESGGLDPQSKESLIRLIFLDGNLEKVLDMYDKSVGEKMDATDRSIVGHMHHKTQILGNGIVGPDHATQAQTADNSELKIAPIEEGGEVPSSLSRRSSNSSIQQAKAQEKEEGDFHKLGAFISKHRSQNDNHDSHKLAAPSGEALREAILAAKGNQSIHNLIDKVKQMHQDELEKILNTHQEQNNNTDGSSGEEKLSVSELPAGIDEQVLDSVINDLTRILTTRQDE